MFIVDPLFQLFYSLNTVFRINGQVAVKSKALSVKPRSHQSHEY